MTVYFLTVTQNGNTQIALHYAKGGKGTEAGTSKIAIKRPALYQQTIAAPQLQTSYLQPNHTRYFKVISI